MKLLNLCFITLVLALGISGAVRALPFAWPEDAALVRGEVTDRFESHYDERFPLKTLGTNLWAAIGLLAFGEGRNGVVVGRDGWLFTEEEFSVGLDVEATRDAQLDAIAFAAKVLAQRGVSVQVALLPSKARLYPEHLDQHEPGAERRALYGQARQVLLARGLDVPDLQAALVACKREEQVFLRTDTHWTPAGARCAAFALAGSGATGPRPFEEDGLSTQPLTGDLMRYLPLDPWFSRLLPQPDSLSVPVEAAPQQAAASGNDLLGDAAVPEVVLIGTSYSADARWRFEPALRRALGEDLLNLASSGSGPLVPMHDYLEDPLPELPRRVVWEIPERYLLIEDRESVDRLQRAAQRFVVATAGHAKPGPSQGRQHKS